MIYKSDIFFKGILEAIVYTLSKKLPGIREENFFVKDSPTYIYSGL